MRYLLGDIHYPFNHVQGMETESLRCFLRSDRIAQYGVRYFMGMDGYTLEGYLELIDRFLAQNDGEEEGHLIIFADDAEYIGTNGWFRLKYQNKPDNVFEACPDAREKLMNLLAVCTKKGTFATFNEACKSASPISDELFFDDDSAWHGGKASTWAKTPMAQLLRPWQDLVRNKLNASDLDADTAKQAWPDKVFWGNINFELYSQPEAVLRQAVIDKCIQAGKRGLAFEISEDRPDNWQNTIPVVLDTLAKL